MKNSEIKVDIEKYKHNEDYRKIIQNRFKADLVQPYDVNGNKNPEYMKRYGEDFYKKKVDKPNEEQNEQNRGKRTVLRNSKGSVFA